MYLNDYFRKPYGSKVTGVIAKVLRQGVVVLVRRPRLNHTRPFFCALSKTDCSRIRCLPRPLDSPEFGPHQGVLFVAPVSTVGLYHAVLFAAQVTPQFAYAHTLLGHEYVMTEELEKALSCFRRAVSIDPRHYNAW